MVLTFRRQDSGETQDSCAQRGAAVTFQYQSSRLAASHQVSDFVKGYRTAHFIQFDADRHPCGGGQVGSSINVVSDNDTHNCTGHIDINNTLSRLGRTFPDDRNLPIF